MLSGVYLFPILTHIDKTFIPISDDGLLEIFETDITLQYFLFYLCCLPHTGLIIIID